MESEIEKLTTARTEEDRARAAHELSCICLGDKIQAKRIRQAVAEGGRVIGVLLQLISPRYASSTQREALWALVLLADEPQGRRAIRANRCFPRLLKLLHSKSESVVETVCQLLARVAYDTVCPIQPTPKMVACQEVAATPPCNSNSRVLCATGMR